MLLKLASNPSHDFSHMPTKATTKEPRTTVQITGVRKPRSAPLVGLGLGVLLAGVDGGAVTSTTFVVVDGPAGESVFAAPAGGVVAA